MRGWIPLELRLDCWTDDAGAEALHAAPDNFSELAEHEASISVASARQHAAGALSTDTRHVRIRLGQGEHAKQAVYATCIRHLITDFLAAIDGTTAPRVGIDAATEAVAMATAATEAAHTRRTVRVGSRSL